MAEAEGNITAKKNGALSFGDYLSTEKILVDGFAFGKDSYDLETHAETTRLVKNGATIVETAPGAAFKDLLVKKGKISFKIKGSEGTRLTLRLESDSLYRITIEDHDIGNFKTNGAGNLSVGIDLDDEFKTIEAIKK